MAKRWTDEGLIVSTKAYGEDSAIVSILTKTNGRYKGYIKTNRNNRAVLQTGNHVHCLWSSRIEDQLGNWKIESVTQYSAFLLSRPGPLQALNSACCLIDAIIPERDQSYTIFYHLHDLIHQLQSSQWAEEYIKFELLLLQAIGYGLDLSHCAVTGCLENLTYVSPKTGRAVCTEVGQPYHDKLLCLPKFLAFHGDAADKEELLQGLKLTEHFLRSQVFTHLHKDIPPWRNLMMQFLTS